MGTEESKILSKSNIYIDTKPILLKNSHWKQYRAHQLTDGGIKYSAFVNSDENHARHAAKQLRVLRHPSILRYCDLFVTGSNTYLITEPVTPLQTNIDHLCLDEIYAGIQDIVTALQFLHEKVGLSHNNICMSSVYVGDSDGSWKLSGLEHLSTYKQADIQFLKQCRYKQPVTHKAPKEVSSKLLPAEHGYARDIYALGRLMEELLTEITCHETNNVVDNFIGGILQQMLDPDFNQRPNFNTILEDNLFRTDFLEIKTFLKNLIIMGEEEKRDFFISLSQRLGGLSEQLIAERLLPLLMTSELLAEPIAVQCIVPTLFTPRHTDVTNKHTGILSTQLYTDYMLRIILELFHDCSTHVRLILLRQAHRYMSLFDRSVLHTTVLPEVLIGLKDMNDEIVVATLHALATITPLLGSEVVIGGERIKYFTDGRPKGKGIVNSEGLNDHNVTSTTTTTDVSAIIGLTNSNINNKPARKSKHVHWSDETGPSTTTTTRAKSQILKLSTTTTTDISSLPLPSNITGTSATNTVTSVLGSFKNDTSIGSTYPPAGSMNGLPVRGAGDPEISSTPPPIGAEKMMMSSDDIRTTDDSDWSDWEDMDESKEPAVVSTVTTTPLKTNPHRLKQPDPLEDHEVIDFEKNSIPELDHSPKRKDVKLNNPRTTSSFKLGEEFEVPSEIFVRKKTPSPFPELDELFAELEPKFDKSTNQPSTLSYDSISPSTNQTMFYNIDVNTIPTDDGWEADTETLDEI